MMGGFVGGLAAGIGSAMQNRKYQQQQIDLQKQAQARQDQLAQSQLETNSLQQQKIKAEMARAQQEQEFQQGVYIAASKGGLPLAMEYATKQGRYDWVQEQQAKQLQLNQEMSRAAALKDQSESSHLQLLNDRSKALAGVSGMVFNNIQGGADPEKAYQQALPTIKEMWPDAPDNYEKAESYMKIALAQQMPQAANYAAYGNIGKAISGLQQAQQAGDTQAAEMFKGYLQKMNSIVDPMTGTVMSFGGNGAPESYPGSVNSKAAAAGLAAGSTGPTQGVVFQGQPMNDFAAQQYKKYDQQNNINPQDRVINNLKPGTGYQTVVHPDGSVEQKFIPGGPGSKFQVTEADAAKTAQLASAQRQHNQLTDILINPDGSINRRAMTMAAFNIPFSQGSLINNINANIIEAYGRAQSGATIPDSEWKNFAREIQPSITDSDETIRNKLLIQHEVLNGTLDLMQRGRDGQLIKDAEGRNHLDMEKIGLIAQASANGGSPLDITKGNGFDPDKMRQNKAKQLSYNPKEVSFYMSAANNGQGRDLTPDEAKQFIDQRNQYMQQQQQAASQQGGQ